MQSELPHCCASLFLLSGTLLDYLAGRHQSFTDPQTLVPGNLGITSCDLRVSDRVSKHLIDFLDVYDLTIGLFSNPEQFSLSCPWRVLISHFDVFRGFILGHLASCLLALGSWLLALPSSWPYLLHNKFLHHARLRK